MQNRQKRPAAHPPTPKFFIHRLLEFSISITKISVAPHANKSSMTVAIRSTSTMALTAIQSLSYSAVMVGARLPGVMVVAVWRSGRGMLYWHRTYFCAAWEG